MAESLQEFSLEGLVSDLRSTLSKTTLAEYRFRPDIADRANPLTCPDWVEQEVRKRFSWAIQCTRTYEQQLACYQAMQGYYKDNIPLNEKRAQFWIDHVQTYQASGRPSKYQPEPFLPFHLPALDLLPNIDFNKQNFDRPIFKVNNRLQTSTAHALGIIPAPRDRNWGQDWVDFLLGSEGQDMWIHSHRDRLMIENLPTKYRNIEANIVFLPATVGMELSTLLDIDSATSRIWLTIPRETLLADYGRMVVAELEKANNTGVSAHRE